ncbi:ATP-binding protein [Caulobacter sp. S45]|uniref:ATP-binding protein n=1 Tax=Caulobacter sp. S45 TaxID=1641861 RepID=UPI001575F920|nr:ATP-binding protein [Caulobacter sp. S45]
MDNRVLILAPRGRDASVIAQTLRDRTIHVCTDVADLEARVAEGAGAVIVTEEALGGQTLAGFATWLRDQPPWSDLPIIVLAAQRVGPRPAPAQQTLADLGNIVIFERPISAETLQRGVGSALRARGRQYVAREHLEERRQFAATLEQRIEERTADLARANLRLVREIEERERMQAVLVQSQKMEAVGQLTGGVAHDFNNLLTIIRSSVDFLRRDDIAASRRLRYVDAISQTVDRAAKLTAQLLAFARRQALVPVEFDVGAQVESVAELVRPLVGSRIEIEVQPAAIPCFTKADVSQFETALINLAVNGRDAMQGEGKLTFRIEAVVDVPSVRGHAGSTGDFVAITVSDCGCGIPAEQLPSIFEPFYTTKEVGKGTGLGLSQVFGFAKQSGGEITVLSETGKGTAFRLYLPRTSGRRTARIEPVVELARTTLPRAGLRVLVVEDNDAVGRFAVEMLADLGHSPTRAANAEEAFAYLGADANGFDAVFSDVMMPGIDGLTMARILRDRFRTLPVLLTSGYSHVVAQEGTHGFELLQKPYSVGALAERLEQVVQNSLSGASHWAKSATS